VCAGFVEVGRQLTVKGRAFDLLDPHHTDVDVLFAQICSITDT
jgi:hypothetical protein